MGSSPGTVNQGNQNVPRHPLVSRCTRQLLHCFDVGGAGPCGSECAHSAAGLISLKKGKPNTQQRGWESGGKSLFLWQPEEHTQHHSERSELGQECWQLHLRPVIRSSLTPLSVTLYLPTVLEWMGSLYPPANKQWRPATITWLSLL